MAKLPKRPRDTAQLAKYMVDMATGTVPKDGPAADDSKAVERGRSPHDPGYGRWCNRSRLEGR